VTGAEVFLLTHSLPFQAFTYAVPTSFNLAPGDIVAVPFRSDIEAGVISNITRLSRPDDPQLKPVLAKLSSPDAGMGFGRMLLALAQFNLCSPKDICDPALWGQASRLISLTLSAGDAQPPPELAHAHGTALVLLGKRRSRITPGLLKKLTNALGFGELVELIAGGSLKITGSIGLAPQKSDTSHKAHQPPLFPEDSQTIPLKPDYALAQQVALALGIPAAKLKVCGRVIDGVRWRELAGKLGPKLLGGDAPILALVPTHWHAQQMLSALPKRMQRGTMVFEPDMPAADYQRLEKGLAQGGLRLIIGSRAAHFLMLQARFAEIVLFDPTAEDYSSGQYPRYDTFADSILLCAAAGAKLTVIAQGPLPIALNKAQLLADVIPLPHDSGERIEKTVETICALAKPGRQLLVYNNAIGKGQEARCTSCRTHIRCPRCGSNASVDMPSAELACAQCGHREAFAACPECGGKQISVEIIGVEALARRVRSHFRSQHIHPAPRVGVLHAERRGHIRVPNLARTDVLIGTSTLFTPLEFYRPHTIVYIAQDAWRLSPHGVPEEEVVTEAARLMSLYGNRTKLVILAPRTLAEPIKAGLAQGGTAGEWDALKQQYSMPPYNVQVDFTIYGQREAAVRAFAEEMNGQLEFGCEILEWQPSRLLPRKDAGWVMRGSVLVKRYSPSPFMELRRRGKGKHIDLVLAPRYY
jgi:primosomal protein N'